MKKLICLLVLMLIFNTTCYAGSIPEDLLHEDDARLFIGRVDGRTTLKESTIPYEENEVIYIDITPVHKFKGDVEIGVQERYTRHDFGNFIPQKDKEYLFAYIDENNFYIYEIKSWDGKTIKLVNSNKYDMDARLEQYINEGSFEIAEKERADLGNQISFSDFLYKETMSDNDAVKASLRYQDNICEVDIDKFLKVADEITVTNVKNGMLQDMTYGGPAVTEAYKTVLYVELLDKDQQVVAYGAVSRFGEVDRYGLFMSRLMSKDYQMDTKDLSKLYSFFPDDMKIGEGVIPPADENSYTGLVTGIVVIVFIIAFVFGFIIYKKKK